MMRLPPSEIELTQAEVTYTLRDMAVRRRAVQAAKKAAAALALQDISGNARYTPLDLDFPRPPTGPLPLSLRLAEPEREEPLISKEPVPRGKRDFWDNIVAEAGSIRDDVVSDSRDGPLRSPVHVHGDTVMTDDSFNGLFNMTGDSAPLLGTDREARNKNQEGDSETIGEDEGLRLSHDRTAYARRRQGDGLDGAGEGSSFSSQSVSNSSLPWRQKDSEDSEGLSSQLEEDVSLGPNHSPDQSRSGRLEHSQSHNTITRADARISTLNHRFSTQLNFNNASEDTLANFLHHSLALVSSDIDSASSLPNPSVLQTSFDDSRSLLQASKDPHRPSQTANDTKMGLKMWSDADYEQMDAQGTGSKRRRSTLDADANNRSSGGSVGQSEGTGSTSAVTEVDPDGPVYPVDDFLEEVASALNPPSINPDGVIDWAGLSPDSPRPGPPEPFTRVPTSIAHRISAFSTNSTVSTTAGIARPPASSSNGTSILSTHFDASTAPATYRNHQQHYRTFARSGPSPGNQQ